MKTAFFNAAETYLIVYGILFPIQGAMYLVNKLFGKKLDIRTRWFYIVSFLVGMSYCVLNVTILRDNVIEPVWMNYLTTTIISVLAGLNTVETPLFPENDI